ncbi:MAG: T9SS type A sorting domain-containing protein [Paludibacter sp.]|nr:T9SS type A sorting domain-containing protein [Paludibacter sp.]
MKKLIILASLLMMYSVYLKADLVLPTGMQILTPTGVTVTVADVRSVDMAKNMVVAGSKTTGYKVYFTASEADHGEELWVSDGTVAGTKMVKDIFPGPTSSGVAWMQRFNDKVVFQAQSGTDVGVELWISDGTEAGTHMVKDINPFDSSNPQGFTQIDETHFVFAAQDFDSQTYASAAQKWLWISDGTEAGTQLLKDCQVFHPGSRSANDMAQHFCRVGRKVFFKADTKDSQYGEELWVTDGTTAGTIMLGDINKKVVNDATGATAGAQLDWFTNFYNEKLFFNAYSDVTGSEPWVSDGTVEGTHLIKDMNVGLDASGNPLGSGTFAARVYKGKVYFRGFDPVYGLELCSTDFTEAGTNMVWDMNTNATTTGTANASNDLFCEFDGVLFGKGSTGGDAAATNPVNYGLELFYSDGTAAGSKMQSDLNPGIGPNAAWEGFVVSGSMFFRAQNATPVGSQTWELFKIDSKDEFPQQVVDLVSGQDFVHTFRNLAGDLIFTSDAVPSLFIYHYRKPNYNPATDTDSLDINYNTRNSTGITNVSQDNRNLILYPNPTKGFFYFDSSVSDLKNVQITDITGKVVYKSNNLISNKVDIPNLQAGMYSVELNSISGTKRNILIVK